MASIRKRERKDGTVFYEITVSRGRKLQKLTKNWCPPSGWSERAIQRQLLKEASDFEREVKEGNVLSRSEQKALDEKAAYEASLILTVKQYGEKVFMPAKEVTCSENTRSSFKSMLEHYIYPVIGDIKLPDVTSSQLTALLLDFQKTHAHSSAVKLYTILNFLFKMAYLDDSITVNPMFKVTRPKPRKDEGKESKVEAYTPEELLYILKCLKNEPLKWQAFIRLMADTGIRRGECCGLTWKNVDFINSKIRITQTLNYTQEAGVYLDTTKSGKSREVDVSPEVLQLLRSLRNEQRRIIREAGIVDLQKRPEYVFTQDDMYTPMFPQTPEHYMRSFSKRYGVDHLHPHKLRHTFASIAITYGADITSVSAILGHADPAITLRVYSHASDESKQRASEKFREALKNAKEA